MPCLILGYPENIVVTNQSHSLFTQMFRRALVKMFEDQDQDCVFMETHMNPKRRMHMVWECIPLDKELGDMAPIYFKVELECIDLRF